MSSRLIGFLFVFFCYCDSFSQIDTNSRIPCDPINYCLCVHNMGGLNDSPNMQKFVTDLNNYFSETCITFSYRIDSNPDYNFYNPLDEDSTNEVQDMVNQYYEKHCINIFWISQYGNSEMNGICEDDDIDRTIFVPENMHTPFTSALFIRRILRYFGLGETQFMISNPELTDKSNGMISADSVWDTPADPFNILGIEQGSVLDNYVLRRYFLSNKKDANGEYYNPLMSNIMSPYMALLEYSGVCNRLTQYQYKFLVENEKKCRHKLWE